MLFKKEKGKLRYLYLPMYWVVCEINLLNKLENKNIFFAGTNSLGHSFSFRNHSTSEYSF